jgi:hypothetical protein
MQVFITSNPQSGISNYMRALYVASREETNQDTERSESKDP